MPTHLKKITGRFYASGSGRRPVRDWLMSLSRDDRRTIGIDIQRIEFGWPLWEVRSDLSDGRIARVMFFIEDAEMVLLHGFEKKTQRTPAQDIELALKRKREVQ
jgi:phage-related protein